MLEIEMKFPVGEFQTLQSKLSAWQATPEVPRVEVDHYYNAPDRDFRRTSEALRIRRIGERNFITYKGPKQPGPTKTRTEHEIPIPDGDEGAENFTRLLELLGYRPVAVVRKTRVIVSFQRHGFDLAACFDDVDGVGKYVEIEIVSPEENKAKAQLVLLAVVKELGLENPEVRSYLRLLVGNR